MPFFTIEQTATDELPNCAGVYRFYNKQEQLLYIGKSITIRKRVRQHYAEAEKNDKHRRMMSQVQTIDCTPTAGEVGALLIENQQIKTQHPLFNQRQRLTRKLVTVALINQQDFLKPHVINFLPEGQRLEDVYGLYPNQKAAQAKLKDLAKENQLCLKAMGLESGKGPCFNYQLKRCQGACVNEVTPEQHNRQLLDLLQQQKIAAWPYPGAVILEETATNPEACQPVKQFHWVNNWAYLGTAGTVEELEPFLEKTVSFDRDAYRILNRVISDGGLVEVSEQ